MRNATGTRISPKTVRRRLRCARLCSRRPYVEVPLTGLQHNIGGLSSRQWKEVIFTDESRCNLKFSDGRVCVWRRHGERMDTAKVVEHDRYGGGSIMV